MDPAELQKAMDDVFDGALLHHSFTPYMRDYEAVIWLGADAMSGIAPRYLRHLFRHCVEVTAVSAVEPDTWRRSLDDRLLEHDGGRDLDGFVWGVRYQNLYPGMSAVTPSDKAAAWADSIGVDFHEVRIETEAQTISIVFSELVVDEVTSGYAPFVATTDP